MADLLLFYLLGFGCFACVELTTDLLLGQTKFYSMGHILKEEMTNWSSTDHILSSRGKTKKSRWHYAHDAKNKIN